MKERTILVPWLVLVAFLAACSTVPKESATVSHTHTIPHLASLGGEQNHFHAAMVYDPEGGDITIRFFDTYERPYNAFIAQRVKSEVTVQGQHPKVLYFRNLRAGLSHYPSGKNVYWKYARTTHIDAKEALLKGLQAFELKAWLPVDGYVYEATFVFPERS